MTQTDTLTTFDPIGLILFAALAAVVVAPFLAIPVLWRYRVAVRKSMARTAIIPPPLPPQRAPPLPGALPAPALRIEVVDAARGSDDVSLHGRQLATLARQAVLRSAIIYGVAGAVQAAAITAWWFILNDIEFLPRRTLSTWCVFAWPIALTIPAVAVASRRMKILGPLGFVAMALLIGAGFTRQIATIWAMYMAVPTVVLLVIANRRLRAAGPFLLVALLLIVVATHLGLWAGAWIMIQLGSFEYAIIVAMIFVSAVVAATLTVVLKMVVARRYARKRTSDQVLLLDTHWLVFTLWECLFLASHSGFAGVAAGLSSFVAFKAAVGLGTRALGSRSTESRPLLLLRTFGARARSERLLEESGTHWRHLGPIQLIAGPDLAVASLNPHEFLSFLSGRLSRSFIKDLADLDQRVAGMDRMPDPDGRYRVNEFFCHADMWRFAVGRLAEEARAVLMDLRGFTPDNKGCIFEIGILLNMVPLKQIVLLIDQTTDEAFLNETLHAQWQQLSSASPNTGLPTPTLRLVRVSTQSSREVRALLDILCEAADAGA